MKNKYLNSGFTLVELMFTVVILAVLVGIAVPSFNGMMQNQELVAQLSRFNSTLAYVRNEAATRSADVVLCSSADGATCGGTTNWDAGWIVFVDSNNDGNPLGDVVLRVESLEGDASLRADTGIISFNEDGELASSVTFQMCGGNANSGGPDTDHSRTIVLSPVGSGRVSKGATCP